MTRTRIPPPPQAQRNRPAPTWLTSTQAANYLGISREMLLRLGADGPRFTRIGKRRDRRYRLSDLDRFIEQSQASPAQP